MSCRPCEIDLRPTSMRPGPDRRSELRCRKPGRRPSAWCCRANSAPTVVFGIRPARASFTPNSPSRRSKSPRSRSSRYFSAADSSNGMSGGGGKLLRGLKRVIRQFPQRRRGKPHQPVHLLCRPLILRLQMADLANRVGVIEPRADSIPASESAPLAGAASAALTARPYTSTTRSVLRRLRIRWLNSWYLDCALLGKPKPLRSEIDLRLHLRKPCHRHARRLGENAVDHLRDVDVKTRQSVTGKREKQAVALAERRILDERRLRNLGAGDGQVLGRGDQGVIVLQGSHNGFFKRKGAGWRRLLGPGKLNNSPASNFWPVRSMISRSVSSKCPALRRRRLATRQNQRHQ